MNRYRSGFHRTRTDIRVLFVGFLLKYLIKAECSQQSGTFNKLVYSYSFFAFIEEKRRPKSVFGSIPAKLHLVQAATGVRPISCQHHPRKKKNNNDSGKPRMAIGRMNFTRLE